MVLSHGKSFTMIWQKGPGSPSTFLLLIILSSLVAGIGLVQSDVAVIIGAMVIAPFPRPKPRSGLWGRSRRYRSDLKSGQNQHCWPRSYTCHCHCTAGLIIAPDTVLASTEMMNRTHVGFTSIILALASGAAAVLSLTMGISSALVGVMVAVALMPPAVTLGFTLGNQQFDLAYGTFLLLATNIVCVNLAAQTIFRFKGIRPRTWYEEKKAKQASRINTLIWFAMLLVLAVLIWLKTNLL